jgi:leucyl-tRNA synthetase
VTIVVQINGKVRDNLQVEPEVARDRTRLETRARELPRVQQLTAGQTIHKVIVVPGRLVNIVAS